MADVNKSKSDLMEEKKILVDVIFNKLFDSESYMMQEKNIAFPFVQRKRIENEVKRYLNENHGFDYSEDELSTEEDLKRLINILKE